MARRRRIKRSEEQWRELLLSYERSGQTQEEYCRGAGISKGTLWKWRKRLKGQNAPQFIELNPESNVERIESARLEVEISGGITLRIWS